MAKNTKYTLTQADLESFLSEKESAGAIARRHGVTPSLVTYYLRKLEDPQVNAVLKSNSNKKAKGDVQNARRERLDKMLLDGRPVAEIVVALRVSTNTVMRARKRLGMYVELAPRKPKRESTGTVHDLLHDVAGTSVFKLLTKPWPVKLKYTTEEAA